MDRPLYPFTAVVGQERAKQALLCLAVEPRIGGVLLCGERGRPSPLWCGPWAAWRECACWSCR
ncbi:MAG: hypothetical protein ACLRWQ_04120 [Flavonifractor plautii]